MWLHCGNMSWSWQGWWAPGEGCDSPWGAHRWQHGSNDSTDHWWHSDQSTRNWDSWWQSDQSSGNGIHWWPYDQRTQGSDDSNVMRSFNSPPCPTCPQCPPRSFAPQCPRTSEGPAAKADVPMTPYAKADVPMTPSAKADVPMTPSAKPAKADVLTPCDDSDVMRSFNSPQCPTTPSRESLLRPFIRCRPAKNPRQRTPAACAKPAKKKPCATKKKKKKKKYYLFYFSIYDPRKYRPLWKRRWTEFQGHECLKPIHAAGWRWMCPKPIPCSLGPCKCAGPTRYKQNVREWNHYDEVVICKKVKKTEFKSSRRIKT